MQTRPTRHRQACVLASLQAKGTTLLPALVCLVIAQMDRSRHRTKGEQQMALQRSFPLIGERTDHGAFTLRKLSPVSWHRCLV